VEIVDVVLVRDIFACCVVAVEINHDIAVFRFGGGFFVFVLKKGS